MTADIHFLKRAIIIMVVTDIFLHHHVYLSLPPQMVSLLLAKGANINAFDKKDCRALHWAAYMGEVAIL